GRTAVRRPWRQRRRQDQLEQQRRGRRGRGWRRLGRVRHLGRDLERDQPGVDVGLDQGLRLLARLGDERQQVGPRVQQIHRVEAVGVRGAQATGDRGVELGVLGGGADGGLVHHEVGALVLSGVEDYAVGGEDRERRRRRQRRVRIDGDRLDEQVDLIRRRG